MQHSQNELTRQLENDSSVSIWSNLANSPWVVLIGVIAGLVAIGTVIPVIWTFIGEKTWNQTCYIAARGADVSISIQGRNASDECQRLINETPKASPDVQFYQLDDQPPGDIVCSLDITEQRGFVVTVRDTGFQLIGHLVCNLYVNPIEKGLNGT